MFLRQYGRYPVHRQKSAVSSLNSKNNVSELKSIFVFRSRFAQICSFKSLQLLVAETVFLREFASMRDDNLSRAILSRCAVSTLSQMFLRQFGVITAVINHTRPSAQYRLDKT